MRSKNISDLRIGEGIGIAYLYDRQWSVLINGCSTLQTSRANIARYVDVLRRLEPLSKTAYAKLPLSGLRLCRLVSELASETQIHRDVACNMVDTLENNVINSAGELLDGEGYFTSVPIRELQGQWVDFYHRLDECLDNYWISHLSYAVSHNSLVAEVANLLHRAHLIQDCDGGRFYFHSSSTLDTERANLLWAGRIRKDHSREYITSCLQQLLVEAFPYKNVLSLYDEALNSSGSFGTYIEETFL